jgi:ubiquinone/menaquinone biosynthesis C-methylase UbiE
MPGRRGFALMLLWLAGACAQPPPAVLEGGAPAPPREVPLDELAVLEAPDREEWQQPDQIMDALRIADGSRVADVGAGSGWFTVRLARRVGPNGRVFAEEVDPHWIDYVTRRVAREGLTNVEPILGTPDDPKLPLDLQAVLLINTFAELPDPTAVLASIGRSLAPDGQLGIVDFRDDGGGGPGPPRERRVGIESVERAAVAAGLRVVSRETFLRYQFFLVLQRGPGSATPAAGSRPSPQS